MADEKPPVLPIPVFSGNTVHIKSTGNDVMLIFSALQPTIPEKEKGEGELLAPVVAITLSRGSAIDLSHVLSGILGTLEKDIGPVNTPFLMERAKAKNERR